MPIGTIADAEIGSSVRTKLNAVIDLVNNLSGIIMMWSGTVASIPTGWVLCDGTSGTPDLRDKFVVGAKQDDTGVAKTNVTGALTQSGGAATHTHAAGSLALADSALGAGGAIADAAGAGAFDSALNSVAINGSTDNGSSLPPYYALAFIMKT